MNPDGQPGSIFTQQQTFIGWAPSEYNVPVMLVLSEVEGTAQSDAVQLASLAGPVVELKPEIGSV